MARYLDISFGLLAFTSSLALVYGAFVESKTWLSVWALGSGTVLVACWSWYFYKKYGLASPESLERTQDTMLGLSLTYAVCIMPVLAYYYKYLESGPDVFTRVLFSDSSNNGGRNWLLVEKMCDDTAHVARSARRSCCSCCCRCCCCGGGGRGESQKDKRGQGLLWVIHGKKVKRFSHGGGKDGYRIPIGKTWENSVSYLHPKLLGLFNKVKK